MVKISQNSADNLSDKINKIILDRRLNSGKDIVVLLIELGIIEVVQTPWMDDVIDHIKCGRKLAAVKAYKDGTGIGLREAKETIDLIAPQYEKLNKNSLLTI